MKNPFPVNLQTSAEVRQQGWQAESRDADGHLTSCHAPIEADDQGIAEWIVECTSRGETVTFWPTNGDQPPAPSSHVVGDLDYCFDPENWEFTCSWPERDQVHGYGESLKPGQPMRVCTLLKGPDKWVADVPITWDEDGEPDETEIKWFDSEEEACAALATTEGKDNG